jgi:hypothetical protein
MSQTPFRQVDEDVDEVNQYISDFTQNRIACAGLISYQPDMQEKNDCEDNAYHNSNFDAIFETKTSDSFVDPVLANIVDNLMDQVSKRQCSTEGVKVNKSKLQKNSNPFLMKSSLNISVVSTNASDDTNSCERSHSDFCCKAGRSDSLTKMKRISRKDSNSLNDYSQSLFEIPEQTPNALIE